MNGNDAAPQEAWNTYLPDSVLIFRNGVVVFLPEDDWRGHTHHPTLQPDRSSLRNTHILQLLHKLGRMLRLFLWGGNTDMAFLVFNWIVLEKFIPFRRWLLYLFLTHDFQFETKWALSCFVACDAGVCAAVILRQRVNDQGMDAILPHQQLVVKVGIDWRPVDQPHQLWDGQSTHLGDTEGWQQGEGKMQYFSDCITNPGVATYLTV